MNPTKTASAHWILDVGDIRQAGDEYKRRRNKIWRPVEKYNVGRPITKLHVKNGFEFRRPVKGGAL